MSFAASVRARAADIGCGELRSDGAARSAAASTRPPAVAATDASTVEEAVVAGPPVMAAAAWLRAPGSPCHHGKRSFCRPARASERFARVEHLPSCLEREYSFRHAEFGGHDGLDLRHGS